MLLVLVLSGGLFYIAKHRPEDAAHVLTLAVTPGDHATGTPTARVTLLEYGDYQCPACAAYFPLVEQIRKDYAGKILFVFRNFPLTAIHSNAEIAALAAEAAGLQGKYFEMYATLYPHQNDWSGSRNAKDIFMGYAESLGLDKTKFSNDLDSDSLKKKIEDDANSGLAAGVQGTPTFFINGKSIQNPQSYDGFKKLIDDALAKNP